MSATSLTSYTNAAQGKVADLLSTVGATEPWCTVTVGHVIAQPTRSFVSARRLAEALTAAVDGELGLVPDIAFSTTPNDTLLNGLREVFNGLPEGYAERRTTWLQLMINGLLKKGVLQMDGDRDAEARHGDTIIITITPSTDEQ